MSVLLVTGEAEPSGVWMQSIVAALPEERIVQPGPGLDRAAVTVAIVAAPPAGSLQGLPSLAFVQSLWAGVDGLVADPTVPAHVPLARLVDPALTAMMVESVLLHVLSLHRQMPAYHAFQADRTWRPLAQRPAADRRTGGSASSACWGGQPVSRLPDWASRCRAGAGRNGTCRASVACMAIMGWRRCWRPARSW